MHLIGTWQRTDIPLIKRPCSHIHRIHPFCLAEVPLLILQSCPRTLIEISLLRRNVGQVIERLPVRHASHRGQVGLMPAVYFQSDTRAVVIDRIERLSCRNIGVCFPIPRPATGRSRLRDFVSHPVREFRGTVVVQGVRLKVKRGRITTCCRLCEQYGGSSRTRALNLLDSSLLCDSHVKAVIGDGTQSLGSPSPPTEHRNLYRRLRNTARPHHSCAEASACMLHARFVRSPGGSSEPWIPQQIPSYLSVHLSRFGVHCLRNIAQTRMVAKMVH